MLVRTLLTSAVCALAAFGCSSATTTSGSSGEEPGRRNGEGTSGVLGQPAESGSGGESSGGTSGGTSDGTSGTSGGTSGSAGSPVCSNASSSAFCLCGIRNDGSPPGPPCSATSVGSAGGCCADAAWPASGSCQCTTYRCDKRAESCTCWLHSGDANGPTSCAPAAGEVCCVIESGVGPVCRCAKGTSCPGGRQVSSCTLNADACSADEKLVTSCN